MPKNVIVVGMPRSGTSLAASIFARYGYFAADDERMEMREGDPFNPDGYFEAESLIEANVNVLKRVGFEFHNTWMFRDISLEQSRAIGNLERLDEDRKLLSRYERHCPWIWKDPRLCHTLAYWWPMIDRERTSVLLVRRDIDEIWNSFLRLKWTGSSATEKDDFKNRVNGHLSAAEHAIAEYRIPHVDIQYSDYSRNPKATAEQINDCFDINLSIEQLGFKKAFNHSGLRGTIERWLEAVLEFFPDAWLIAAKKVLPNSLIKALFPSKSS